MKVKYEQSFRNDLPGNVVVDHEDGSDLEIISCYPENASETMSEVLRLHLDNVPEHPVMLEEVPE